MYINVYNNILYIYAQYTCWMILYWHIGAGWPSKGPDIIAAALPNRAAGERCDLPWSERQTSCAFSFSPRSIAPATLGTSRLPAWTDGALVPKGLTCVLYGPFYGENDGQPLFFSIGILLNPSNGRLRNALSRFQQKRTAPILEVLMHCKWNWTFILWGFDSSWNLAHPWWIFLQSSTNSRIF